LSTVYAATAKAAELLGWRATRTLPEMAADLWRWQASNPNGYPPNATFFRDQRPTSRGSAAAPALCAGERGPLTRAARAAAAWAGGRVLAAARAVSRAVASSQRAVKSKLRRTQIPARRPVPGSASPSEELQEL
jgi:hypothetical protein